jgi:signal transduction histidine kinase
LPAASSCSRTDRHRRAVHRPVTDLLAHTLGGLVRLDWQVEEGVWPVYADGTQLELALMNLIINARDAMPDGGTIRVCARARSVGHDNGLDSRRATMCSWRSRTRASGIPPDLLERVTEPFLHHQGGAARARASACPWSTGFARQSGGSLSIHSQEGEGTSVQIWLPRARSEPRRRRIGRGGGGGQWAVAAHPAGRRQ